METKSIISSNKVVFLGQKLCLYHLDKLKNDQRLMIESEEDVERECIRSTMELGMFEWMQLSSSLSLKIPKILRMFVVCTG